VRGVVLAQGSRFGGHALLVKDGKPWYVYNFTGIPPNALFSARSDDEGAQST
jgi:arylsulfatase